MHVWLGRSGVICQFVALWLIAPELAGEARLKRFRQVLPEFLSNTIFLILILIAVGLALTVAFREGMVLFHRIGLAMLFSSIVLLPKIFLYKVTKEIWLPKLVTKLAEEKRFRRGLLILGGGIFTVGTVLLMFATNLD